MSKAAAFLLTGRKEKTERDDTPSPVLLKHLLKEEGGCGVSSLTGRKEKTESSSVFPCSEKLDGEGRVMLSAARVVRPCARTGGGRGGGHATGPADRGVAVHGKATVQNGTGVCTAASPPGRAGWGWCVLCMCVVCVLCVCAVCVCVYMCVYMCVCVLCVCCVCAVYMCVCVCVHVCLL